MPQPILENELDLGFFAILGSICRNFQYTSTMKISLPEVFIAEIQIVAFGNSTVFDNDFSI